MSKAKQRLVEVLRSKMGDTVTPERMVDEFYRMGLIDDVTARNALVHEAFLYRLASTATSTRQVEFDVAYEYGVTRSTIQYILRKALA
jgi:hypothetical protein